MKTIEERLAVIRQRGPMRRDGAVAGVDRDARTVEVAWSSETPVSRWGDMETLSHDPGAADLSQLNDSAPLLWNHNWNDQRGVVVPGTARIDPDKRGRATVRISRSAAGDELLQDIADGIRTKVSVGYWVNKIRLTNPDVNDDYTVTAWKPYEISFASVPADPSVGVGRAATGPVAIEPETPQVQDQSHSNPIDGNIRSMPDPALNSGSTPAAVTAVTAVAATASADSHEQARRAGEAAAHQRVLDLLAMGKRYGDPEGAEQFIRDGGTVADFQRHLLERHNERAARPLNEQVRDGAIGLTEREAQGFSFLKLVRAQIEPTNRRIQEEARFELEASAAAAERAGITDPKRGLAIPAEVLVQPMLTRAAGPYTSVRAGPGGALNTNVQGDGPGDTGGNLIATNLLASSFIDVLRNRAILLQRCRSLGGLVGNVDIPRQTAASNAYWLGEDQDATQTGPDLGMVTLRPKTVGAFAEITRKLLLQSSLDVEALVRDDLAKAMALEIDRAGYYGNGSDNQPLGLAHTTGINAITWATANAPSFAELVAMETAIALGNADVPGMAYIGGAGFRGYAKTALKFPAAPVTSGGTSLPLSGTIWEPDNQVNGYDAQITNQIPPGDLFFGNFGDLICGLWSGLSLMVDPYSNSLSGRIRLVVFQDVDFVVRRTASFAYGANPVATPTPTPTPTPAPGGGA